MGAEASTPAADPAPTGRGGRTISYQPRGSCGGGGGGGFNGRVEADPYNAGNRRRRRRRRPSDSAAAASTGAKSMSSPAQSSPNSASEYGRRKHFKCAGAEQHQQGAGAQVGESGDTAAASTYNGCEDCEQEVEVIAPCRTAADEELDEGYNGAAGQQFRGGPTMTRPTVSAYAPSPIPPSSAHHQPMCWGWLPRSLTAQSSMPAISVVSDESGGSSSTNNSAGSWLYGKGYGASSAGPRTSGRGGATDGSAAAQHERSDVNRKDGGSTHDKGDDTPRAGHCGGGSYRDSPQQWQHQGLAPPAHPLSGSTAGSDSFAGNDSSFLEIEEPPSRPSLPAPAPISGRKSSRKSAKSSIKSSKKSSTKSSRRTHSRQASREQEQQEQHEEEHQQHQESADCHETCLPQNCLPSMSTQNCLPGQGEGQQQPCLPDITCGVGEIAQANWEAFTREQFAGEVPVTDADAQQRSQPQPHTPAHGNIHHSEDYAQYQQHPAHPHRVQSPESQAKLRRRDELLTSASQYEMNGDHSSALQCYERCLTEYHRHSFAPAHSFAGGNPMSASTYGPPVDVVVVPSSASVEVADVLHRIGVVHWKSGSYDESVRVLRESLAIYRRRLRPDIAHTYAVVDDATGKEIKVNADADALAGILNSLGRVHLSRGECGSAMRAYQESLSIQEAVYSDPSDLVEGGDDASTGTGVTFDTTHTGLTSKNSFASSTAALSTLSGAQSFDTRASRKSTKSTKSKATKRALSTHPLIARTVIAIGQVYDARGNYAKSLRRYKSGLKAQRKSLGPDHVDVAATLNSMGLAQERLGRHDVAERCYEEALRIYRLNLGDGHVDTAVALNNLGQVHHHRGRYDAAMGCYVDALRIMRAVLGDSHRNVAATLHNVGLVHSAKGKYDKALKIYREVLRAQRAALGDGHVDVAVTLDSIASAYEGKGRFDRSLKFYGKALRVRRSALGKRHPFVAVTLHRMGKFHVDCDGDWYEAERRLNEARELYLETNGDDETDPRIVEVEEYLDRCRRERANAPPSAENSGIRRSATPSRDDESDGEE